VPTDAAAGRATAILRPTDLTLSTPGAAKGPAIAGRVRQDIYLGADLHYLVDADAGGAVWRVTAKDYGAVFRAGDAVAMVYAPANVHLIRGEG